LQDYNFPASREGTELVKIILSSTNAEVISSGFLLIVHLLWDIEWIELLTSNTRQLVSTAIRWELFAMKGIIQCEKEREHERSKQETKEYRLPIDQLLSHCSMILCLAGKLENGLECVVKYGGLSMIVMCPDIPISDTNAALAGLGNTGSIGIEILVPGNFSDPAHLLRAIIIGSRRAVNYSNGQEGYEENMVSSLVVLVGNLKRHPGRNSYFKELPHVTQKDSGRLLDSKL
jgi:hypothetical protein